MTIQVADESRKPPLKEFKTPAWVLGVLMMY